MEKSPWSAVACHRFVTALLETINDLQLHP
jgi:hypothetical protein